MERLSTVQHNGVPILLVDYRELKDPAATLALVAESTAQIVAAPPASVRVLMAVAGATLAPEMLGALKDAVLRIQPHLKGVAIVGLTGFLRTIVEGLARTLGVAMPVFDHEQDAVDWLAALP